jgi:molybdenum-dependent DNA-binding transcriptional regulator ModE
MWRAEAWSCVWASPQALSVPELPSSDDSHCGNNHGSHLANRLLRRRSLLEEKQKLPLTKWFQAFYLVGDAKTGISSLSLMRKLGVNYRTAWLLHNKIMQAMSEREKSYVLRG